MVINYRNGQKDSVCCTWIRFCGHDNYIWNFKFQIRDLCLILELFSAFEHVEAVEICMCMHVKTYSIGPVEYSVM